MNIPLLLLLLALGAAEGGTSFVAPLGLGLEPSAAAASSPLLARRFSAAPPPAWRTRVGRASCRILPRMVAAPDMGSRGGESAKRGGGKAAPSGSRRGRGKRGGSKGEMLKGIWRIFNVDVPVEEDPGKDDVGAHMALAASVAAKLGLDGPPSVSKVRVVRKSFDARGARSHAGGREVTFQYVVDVDFGTGIRVRHRKQQGQLEKAPIGEDAYDPTKSIRVPPGGAGATATGGTGVRESGGGDGGKRVVVVGSGPAGLFAALVLAEAGVNVVVVERGREVEQRGRDIGALMHRRVLQRDSNICYGEGGAGTWSDGKLTTRIGRNSGPVRYVLEQLVRFGAPEEILKLGKPHLGTDRLVVILKAMRGYLAEKGVDFRFGCRVEHVDVKAGKVTGVRYRRLKVDGSLAGEEETLAAERVVLASGHTARELYESLAVLAEGRLALAPKGFAVGFRIEHPQSLINELRLGGEFALQAEGGRGKVPVADYRLATEIPHPIPPQEIMTSVVGDGWEGTGGGGVGNTAGGARPVFSFCMCPGGQIVCTSVDPGELCINGMSFSRRHSKWANSALVASVESDDDFLQEYISQAAGTEGGHHAMGGLLFQRAMEREAALRGGGGLRAPVQRVTDFLDAVPSKESLDFPTSSYRLGVQPGSLHDIYPSHITRSITSALLEFDKRLPGFVTPHALLHGVETRTSSPLRVIRDTDSLQCVGIQGLYPAGEGAGYAGGIVSAAVDGERIATTMLEELAGLGMTI